MGHNHSTNYILNNNETYDFDHQSVEIDVKYLNKYYQ